MHLVDQSPQVKDIRAAFTRALETRDELQRLWAVTDLVAALAAAFDPEWPTADEVAEIGAELAAAVHEHAHVVADSDLELLEERWVEVTYAAWARGWPWADELADAV